MRLVDLPVFFDSCSVRLGFDRRGCLGSGRGAISVSGAIVIARVKLGRLSRLRFVCADRGRGEILSSTVSSRSRVGHAYISRLRRLSRCSGTIGRLIGIVKISEEIISILWVSHDNTVSCQ
jgi:hypothetical protein